MAVSDLPWKTFLNADRQAVRVPWSIPEYLEEVLALEPQLVVEILQLYLHDAAANLTKLCKQISVSDVRAIGMTLHALKGSCRQVGAFKMGDDCEAIEAGVPNGIMEPVKTCLRELEAEFHYVRSEMKEAIVLLTKDETGS